MECLIHSPASNSLKMAWVAGVGEAAPAHDEEEEVDAARRAVREGREAPLHLRRVMIHIVSKSVLLTLYSAPLNGAAVYIARH